MVGNESPFSGLSPAAPLRVNIREAVQIPRVRRCRFRRYISMLCPPLAELRPFANSFGPFHLRTFLGHAKPDRRGSASLPLTTNH